jgi:hypothetical protein
LQRAISDAPPRSAQFLEGTVPPRERTQRRLQPIVDGRHVQPRRRAICALLRRASGCRDGSTDAAADDDLYVRSCAARHRDRCLWCVREETTRISAALGESCLRGGGQAAAI